MINISSRSSYKISFTLYKYGPVVRIGRAGETLFSQKIVFS